MFGHPLQITLQIPGAYNLSVDLPIVVGTVPLRSRPPHYRSVGALGRPRIHFYPPAPPYSEGDDDDMLPVERKRLSEAGPKGDTKPLLKGQHNVFNVKRICGL